MSKKVAPVLAKVNSALEEHLHLRWVIMSQEQMISELRKLVQNMIIEYAE